MKNEEKLLGYFRQYPFAALTLLTSQEFGREAGLGVVLSAMKSGKWHTTFAELIMFGEQSRQACCRYEEALRILGQDCDHDALVKHTIALWLKFKKDNPWTMQLPFEPLLSFFGRANEMMIFAGLQTMKNTGLITLCENHVVSPTDQFFDRLLPKCRSGGLIAL